MIENHFLDNSSLWVGLSFIIFIFLVYKPLKQNVNKSLEEKIKNLKKRIDDSEIIKKESKVLLELTEKKMNEAKSSYKSIIDETKKKINQINIDSKNTLQMTLKKQNQKFKQKIIQENDLSNDNIKYLIINTALSVAKQKIIDDISDNDNRRLINLSLKDIELP